VFTGANNGCVTVVGSGAGDPVGIDGICAADFALSLTGVVDFCGVLSWGDSTPPWETLSECCMGSVQSEYSETSVSSCSMGHDKTSASKNWVSSGPVTLGINGGITSWRLSFSQS